MLSFNEKYDSLLRENSEQDENDKYILSHLVKELTTMNIYQFGVAISGWHVSRKDGMQSWF